MEQMFKLPAICQQYDGRTIFVTGASGFIMIEKMLYSLPGIKQIYILVRSSRGRSGAERWKEYEKLILFNRIRRDFSERLSKIKIIEGDISLPEFGMSSDDIDRVVRDTSIVFHCAAIIRLNAPLKEAVNVNVQGTMRLLSLCHRMPKLECYLHCSTCYVNSDKKGTIIEEKLYPPPCDPQIIIEAEELMSDRLFESIGKEATKMFGNTYCFTKNLAEHIVNDSNLPALIFRPSGFGGVWTDGIPGWADSFQGVTGLTALFCTGAIARIPLDINDHVDAIPVDVVASAMIVCAAYRMAMSGNSVPIIHCNSSSLNPLVFKDVWSSTIECVFKYPLNNMLATPVLSSLGSDKLERSMHKMRQKYMGPALDKLLEIVGQKPFFARLYGRIADSYGQVRKFLTGYTFKTDNLVSLIDMMEEEDRESFNIDVRNIAWDEYVYDCYFGMKVFLMKDIVDSENIRRARRNVLLHRIKDFLFTFVICYISTLLLTGSTTAWHFFLPLTLVVYCYFSVFIINPSGAVPSIENYKKRVEAAMGEPLKSLKSKN